MKYFVVVVVIVIEINDWNGTIIRINKNEIIFAVNFDSSFFLVVVKFKFKFNFFSSQNEVIVCVCVFGLRRLMVIYLSR